MRHTSETKIIPRGVINLLIVLCLIMFSKISQAAESYICETEASGGVKFNFTQNKYEGTVFRSDGKYVLTLNKSLSLWEWKEFGDKIAKSMSCNDKDNFVRCKLIGGEMGFSKSSLRFYETYTLPWAFDTRNVDKNSREILQGNTPYIKVGICASIN